MTDDTRNRTEARNRAMNTVDHTHPDTGRPFGEQVVFARGPTVVADGGERGAEAENVDPETDASDEDEEAVQMKDVDHEPPNESDANRVFERGREGRDSDR